jgi:hypothetical protein
MGVDADAAVQPRRSSGVQIPSGNILIIERVATLPGLDAGRRLVW